MEVNREQAHPRLKLRIGPMGETWSYATLNVMGKAIDGIDGRRYVGEATQSLRNNGAIDIPDPTYGYLGGLIGAWNDRLRSRQ